MKRAVAELLVVCAKEHDWSQPLEAAVELATGLPPDRVLSAADYHRVAGCVLASLRGSPRAPDDLMRPLAAVVRRSSGRAVLVAAALRAVRLALGEEVRWVVVKGPVLDAVVYPRPRLRSYRDLDVLVEPHDLELAVRRLEDAGYHLVDRNWRLIREKMASELHLEREGSAPVDLHWTLVFGGDLRETFRFDLGDMIERARPVVVADGPVLTFDASDTLIHLAVHAAIEGGDRLVWLKDIDVATRDDVDWEDVVDRAVAYGVHLPVATMLARSARVLGAPVPPDVVAGLAPAAWRSLTAVADAVFPAAASRGIGTPATLLARSARRDVRSTLRVAALGLRQRLGALATGRVERADVRSDPRNEGSLLYTAGDDADREEYFARLAAL